MFNRALTACLLLLSVGAAALQLPMRLNFQGKLLDPATSLPRNGTFDLTFGIYRAASGGAALYTEAQPGVAVNNGVFSVQIGAITPLNQELFIGASAYLGITVNNSGQSTEAEMTPRQYLAMSPYAFTAGQLAAATDIRINPGVAYSTFTGGGNLFIAAGVTAGTATITGSLTASSGTFTATGLNQFSLNTTSGVQINAGTLDVNGAGGVDVLYGVTSATAAVTQFGDYGAVATPAVSPAGLSRLAYDSTKDALSVSVNARAHSPLGSGSATMWNTDATGGIANQGLNLPAALTELDSAVGGTRMQVDCAALPAQVALRYNFRALAATALTMTISVRDTSNTANILATVSRATSAVGTYTGQGTLAAKPGWCTGTQQVAVYTEGGNGAADYIFKHVLLISAP